MKTQEQNQVSARRGFNQKSIQQSYRPSSGWGRVFLTALVLLLATSLWVWEGTNTTGSNATTAASQIVNDEYAAHTGVKELAFTATRYKGGKVLMKWDTGSEVDNLGFNIYREDAQGKREQLNGSLIAGSSFAVKGTPVTAGTSYAWLSEAPSADAAYYVEDVDLSGKTTMHGPFYAAPGKGKAPAMAPSTVLGRLGAEPEQAGYPASIGGAQALAIVASGEQAELKSQEKPQTFATDGTAIKLGVTREGWYRITGAELRAAGLSNAVKPQNLQLFADGIEQPMLVNTTGNGKTTVLDSLEFYGAGVDTLATNKQIYWLVEGATHGKRIKAEKADGKGKGKIAAATCFDYTVERRDRTIYFSSLLNGDADNFFGAVVSPNEVTQTLTLANLDQEAAANARLTVSLQGVTNIYWRDPDHIVRVVLNGYELGQVEFDGQALKEASFEVPQSWLTEGVNTVKLKSLSGSDDVNLVESLRLTYKRCYRADNDRLMMSAMGGDELVIVGFTNSQVRVVDVTDPQNPAELVGKVVAGSSGYTVNVTPQEKGIRKLLAFTDSRAEAAYEVKANQASEWSGAHNGADYLVLTHEKFAVSLEPLLALRKSQGFITAVVNVEDVYDEYNYGVKSYAAIREMLRQTQGWARRPQYVLLVGDASYDPRNYIGGGHEDYVPSKIVTTSYIECPSDDWFVDFDEDSLPELAIGRLPVRTVTEADRVVGKILTYEARAGQTSSAKKALYVSDYNDGYNFQEANDELASMLPAGTEVQKVYRGYQSDAASKSQIVAAVNSGQTIVSYKGHGSVGLWRGLLSSNDAATMTNGQSPALFITMTCLTGYFNSPNSDCLAEAMLRTADGGAVAYWGSSSLTLASGQTPMHMEAQYLLLNNGEPLTIGEAMRRAKASSWDPETRRSWNFFGDPAMRLH